MCPLFVGFSCWACLSPRINTKWAQTFGPGSRTAQRIAVSPARARSSPALRGARVPDRSLSLSFSESIFNSSSFRCAGVVVGVGGLATATVTRSNSSRKKFSESASEELPRVLLFASMVRSYSISLCQAERAPINAFARYRAVSLFMGRFSFLNSA